MKKFRENICKTQLTKRMGIYLLLMVGFLHSASAQSDLQVLLKQKAEAVQTAAQVKDSDLSRQTLQTLAGDLERIALASPDHWHAQYYAAYAYIELAFRAPKKDIDQLCDRAQEFLDQAIKLRPNESENHVLKAYLLSAKINVNAMFRGASMGKESKAELDRALELNPENPRAHYVRAMGIYYTPAVFGGGQKKAKPHLDRSAEHYQQAASADRHPLDPQWGHQAVKELLHSY